MGRQKKSDTHTHTQFSDKACPTAAHKFWVVLFRPALAQLLT